MASLILLVELRVTDAEAFRPAAQRLIAISEAEPGTLRYEWFSSDDGLDVRIIEEFADEAALDTHGANIAEAITGLLAAADLVRTGVLGEVSEQRRARMAGPGTGFLGYFAGFKR
jgi:quinol monooxygenase YgiN